MHVLVTACLQQDAPVLRAHREGVGGLLGESRGSAPRPTAWRLPPPRRGCTHLQHGLLVLAVLHLGLGEVEYGPLHRVLVRVVDVDVGAPDHHEALHPPVGVGLQEVQVALFGDDGAAEGGDSEEVAVLGRHPPCPKAPAAPPAPIGVLSWPPRWLLPDPDLLNVGHQQTLGLLLFLRPAGWGLLLLPFHHRLQVGTLQPGGDLQGSGWEGENGVGGVQDTMSASEGSGRPARWVMGSRPDPLLTLIPDFHGIVASFHQRWAG